MKSIILAIIFAVHAVVFARIYLARGRRLHALIMFFGFVLLLGYCVYDAWITLGATTASSFASYVRWAGIALCVGGLPWFLAGLYARIRTRRLQGRNSLDSGRADN